MAAGEAAAQLYIASFIMDEARHFETLTRLYRTLGEGPLSIREMPELLRYYQRLRQGDRLDWVWGILISDIIGKHFYRELGPKRPQPDPFFGGLTVRILKDESRHLVFAEHYLKRNLPMLVPERRRAMIDIRDELMRLLESMSERVRAGALAFDVEIDDFVEGVEEEIDGGACRVGLLDREGGPPHSGAGAAEPTRTQSTAPNGPTTRPPVAEDNFVVRCFGCRLSLICNRRLTRARTVRRGDDHGWHRTLSAAR